MVSLPKVLEVIPENCVNCHRCISVCPVKYCNDGSKDYVTVNQNLCIGCGECIAACEHNARRRLDDFDAALKSLKNKEPVVAIAAPGVAANFPNQYLHLNGWLKSIGVSAVFDVSFGAELTIKSYLEHIKENHPKTVIAQPCPAIVTYIEIYEPELIPYLAPVDSPMMHTMKMIKHFYPQYKEHKILIVSPCIAKKREFVEVGIGDFNVTMVRISEYLKQQNIDLKNYTPEDYANEPAERAVLFSTPGGLLRTAMREYPEVINLARKIEGPHLIYKYLRELKESIKKGVQPLLIDCLNCELGCNGGTGTLSQKANTDEIEHLIEVRNKQAQKWYEEKNSKKSKEEILLDIQNTVNKYWKKNLYNRNYKNLASNNTLIMPSKIQIQEIFKEMMKENESDIKNCNSCGYNSCEKMAVAIFNKLNRVENCHFYLQKIKERDKKIVEEASKIINQKIENLSRTDIQASYAIVQNLISNMNNLVGILRESFDIIVQLSESNKQIKNHIQDILKIAKKVNLLSINASIESSKAGVQGKGFKVLAQEIKELSTVTNNFTKEVERLVFYIDKNTQQIIQSIEKEKKEANNAQEITDNLGKILGNIVKEIEGVAALFTKIS